MTTPTERIVLEAAMRWREDTADRNSQKALLAATDALAAERAASTTERHRCYSELVAGDLIQSTNGKWYEVDRTVTADDDTSIKVWLKGVAKPIEKLRGMDVLVRRSDMGAAVDMFANVLWSGPTPGARQESAA